MPPSNGEESVNLEMSAELRQVIREIVREELESMQGTSEEMGKCAWCEGSFPVRALNYSSGDPACAACMAAFDPKPIRPYR